MIQTSIGAFSSIGLAAASSFSSSCKILYPSIMLQWSSAFCRFLEPVAISASENSPAGVFYCPGCDFPGTKPPPFPFPLIFEEKSSSSFPRRHCDPAFFLAAWPFILTAKTAEKRLYHPIFICPVLSISHPPGFLRRTCAIVHLIPFHIDRSMLTDPVWFPGLINLGVYPHACNHFFRCGTAYNSFKHCGERCCYHLILSDHFLPPVSKDLRPGRSPDNLQIVSVLSKALLPTSLSDLIMPYHHIFRRLQMKPKPHRLQQNIIVLSQPHGPPIKLPYLPENRRPPLCFDERPAIGNSHIVISLWSVPRCDFLPDGSAPVSASFVQTGLHLPNCQAKPLPSAAVPAARCTSA